MAYRLRIRNWNDLYENNRTRDLKNLNWVPIPNRMDGDSYTELVDHPSAAAHYGAWIAMVSIASRQEPRGVLPREGAGIPQALARISRLPASLFEELIPRLIQMKWIECFEGVMEDTAAECDNPAPSCDIPAGECVEGKGMNEGKGSVVGAPEVSAKDALPKIKESAAKASATRGTRLTIEQLPKIWGEWSVSELQWDRDRCLTAWANFHDYWVAVPGKDGLKLDWLATWRKWCRNQRSAPFHIGNKANGTGGYVPGRQIVIERPTD